MRVIEVRKIWDNAPHNAFTDLSYFQGKWFCVFREGKTHLSADGVLRVVASVDGRSWNSAALIASGNSDLRDPKLSVSPDGQLTLSAAAVLHNGSLHSLQSSAWLSHNGVDWGEKRNIGDPDFWLWRITWHKQAAYAIGYCCKGEISIRLYRSRDGIHFEPLVRRLFIQGFPNETSLVFKGDSAYCLLRRDGNPDGGLLGVSEPPYTEWLWKDLAVRVGAPHMLLLPNGTFVAAVRLYDKAIRTSICSIDPEKAGLTEILRLPSGGDTGYAGLALHEGLLWVSYHSSHEGNAAIYLAKVEIAAFP